MIGNPQKKNSSRISNIFLALTPDPTLLFGAQERNRRTGRAGRENDFGFEVGAILFFQEILMVSLKP